MPDRQRFERIWSRLTGADAAAAWQALDRGYGEPARSYHNWLHIEAMLNGLDAVRGEPEFSGVDFDAVELAIWFHDAIYHPLAKDNEARSAELLRAFADQAGLNGQTAEHVEAMILATTTHGSSGDASTRLMLDLDLAVLGGSAEDYRRYVRAVRKEYAAVPDDAWRIGRPAVLKRFLERERIFQMHQFEQLEAQARRNLADEIAALES